MTTVLKKIRKDKIKEVQKEKHDREKREGQEKKSNDKGNKSDEENDDDDFGLTKTLIIKETSRGRKMMMMILD